MTEQAKHTPGPYYIDENNLVRQESTDAVLATIEDGCHADIADFIAPDQQDANGSLFAAAPELLQACREALADLEGYLAEWETDPALETVQELRAVIAKATGQD